jgi:3-oxoacyl-[acyl-carrier protein] reductase
MTSGLRFSGKTVMITGGASVIGGAATRAFAANGAKVAFTYVTSADEAKAIQTDLRGAEGQALAIKADMTDPATVVDAFSQAEAALGPVDILFANAGGLLKRSRCVETSIELWHEAIAVNLTSTFLACQAALRSMEQRKSDTIVLMSSLAAFDGGGPGASHYAATKGAVATYVRSLAKEVGPLGIRVNGVAPGLIGTRFHDVFNTPEGRKATAERTPLRREGTPEDVAEVVLFLASDSASYLSGEIIQINGGLRMI